MNNQNIVYITPPQQFITCLSPTTEGRTIIKNISESQEILVNDYISKCIYLLLGFVSSAENQFSM